MLYGCAHAAHGFLVGKPFAAVQLVKPGIDGIAVCCFVVQRAADQLGQDRGRLAPLGAGEGGDTFFEVRRKLQGHNDQSLCHAPAIAVKQRGLEASAMSPARVLLADPPWLFRDALPGKTRGASRQYRCMTVDELCAMPLPKVADDALLLLWRVAAMDAEARTVARAWGFAPHSELVWIKTSSVFDAPEDEGQLPAARLAFGMGRIVRGAHEVCLICKRGQPEILDHSVRSVFFAPRGRHSEKPEEIYRIAQRLRPGPHVELFARRRRHGWVQYGDELPPRRRRAA